MNHYQSHTFEPDKFITIAVNLLHKVFVDSSRDEAKRLFLKVKGGDTAHLVRIKMEDDSELDMKLSLDHSEFLGKLNYAAFKNVLQAMLARIAQQVQGGGELDVFTDEETGSILFNLPGMMQDGEHLNMLVLGADLAEQGAVTLKLQFLDVSQFVEETKEGGQGA